MKAAKELAATFLIITSLTATAAERSYKCTGEARGDGDINSAEVTFTKGLSDNISKAKISISIWSRVISKEYRGPVKTPKAGADVLKSSYLEDKENSVFNLFGNVSYLILDGNTEQLSYSALGSALPLTVYYTTGAVGNRGSEQFNLNCEVQ